MVFIFDLTINPKNGEYFRRYVMGARYNRGKNIPNRNIINFNIDKKPKIKIISEIQGSGNSRYVINIFEDDNGFKIIHDCPDFKKGTKLCKHIVKILFLIDLETCKLICQNYSTLTFSSNFSLVKESKTKSFIIKAEELIQNSKYYEAIAFLERAYSESKNFDDIKKASEIALNHDIHDQFIKFSVDFPKLFEIYKDNYPQIINSTISKISQFSFSKKVEILVNIQKLMNKFSKNLVIETLKQLEIEKLGTPILKYLLLYKLDPSYYLEDYFKGVVKNPNVTIKNFFEERIINLMNEAILNIEPEEEVNIFATISRECDFSNYNTILSQLQDYRKKLKKMYIEALKIKHAYLRSLVIANTNTDKLREMKFTEKYNYPSLIWTQAYLNEAPLHYYILEKCGFERHHLEYINKQDFIENYPVFKTIFNGNNPIRYGVEDFWGINEPTIFNTVQNERITELNFKVNFEEFKNYLLIEWDLAQKPILGSYICQFKDGFLIPDKNHPLTHEIQPFDLILCDEKPIIIRGNGVKIFRPIRRINIATAIELVWKGINFISSYLPLNLIRDLRDYVIDDFDAYNKIDQIFKTSFLPKKDRALKHFNSFIRQKVLAELNNTYLKVIQSSDYKEKVLRMIGFTRYSKFFHNPSEMNKFRDNNLKRESLQELKLDLKKFVSKKLTETIKNKEFENINIKILKKFPTFKKFTAKVILELKNQLEGIRIIKIDDNQFDIRDLNNNYYGRLIAEDLLKNKSENIINTTECTKLLENFKFLGLKKPKISKKFN
ncbi:MAG: hypothetical protein ACFFA3_06380 [Promethearchaeota archaeon]